MVRPCGSFGQRSLLRLGRQGAMRAILTVYWVRWWLSVYPLTHCTNFPSISLENCAQHATLVTRLVPLARSYHDTWCTAERLSLGRNVHQRSQYCCERGLLLLLLWSARRSDLMAFSTSMILSLSLDGICWRCLSWVLLLTTRLIFLWSALIAASVATTKYVLLRMLMISWGCHNPSPAKIYCPQVCRLCWFLWADLTFPWLCAVLFFSATLFACRGVWNSWISI